MLAFPGIGLSQDAQSAPTTPAEAAAKSKISGTIRNASNKKVVPDVVVTLKSPGLRDEMTSVSTAQGAYSFSDLPAGEYQMNFEGPGYLPFARSVTVVAGRNLSFNADLAPDTAQSEEIVVTGSRVPGIATETYSPVTKVSRAQIEASGQAWVGDFLQQLPEVSGAINTQFNNGGDGSTRVNLRGFGPASRTLVLLNGRRIVAGGTGADSSVDTLTIPSAAVDRIEILKDGASAVYGSDAISGVVNFITRSEWSGTELSVTGGITGKGDGSQYQVSLTTGHLTDKGSILFSASYTGQAAIWAGDRAWSKYDRGGAYDWNASQIFTNGSSATPFGRFRIGSAVGPGNAAWTDIKSRFPSGNIINDPVTGWRRFNASGVTDAGGDFYNYQPSNYVLTPNNRLNLFATGTYKIADSAKLYFEAMYTHRESSQRLATNPLFFDTEGITVSRDSIYNPFNVDIVNSFRIRPIGFGPRLFTQDLDTFRIVAGARGEFIPQWHWDISVNYGRTQGVATTDGLQQASRLRTAVGPSFRDAAGGYHCGTEAAPIENCVPFDVFHGAAGVTPAMGKSINFKGTSRGINQEVVAGAYTSAELVKIANAASAIGLAAGFEHRNEYGALINDPLTNTGDVVGNKTEDTAGGYYTNEVYAELNAPILGRFGDSAGAGNLLSVTAAGRYVNYNNFGSNLSYRLGARLSPVQDITLRGNWATGFRAPSIGELFGGQFDGFPAILDPCSGRTTGSAVDLRCLAEGVPAGLMDDRSQQLTRSGGNPALKPELSTSLSAGIVIQPRWIPDLSLSLDYYQLRATSTITSIGATVILSSCYQPPTGQAPKYCDRVERDPATGLINRIVDTLGNAGGDATSGFDLVADYSPMTPIGRVGLNVNMNFVTEFNTTLADGRVVQGLGVYDNGISGANKVRGQYRLSWANYGFSGAVNVRFLGGFKECVDNNCEQAANAAAPLSRQIPGWAQADINVAYRHEWTPQASTTIGVGINNLFDVAPVYLVNGFNGYDASAYNGRGRFFYANITHNFK
jgi:outer membrane receptor protein involved in Fe transport